MGRFVGTLGARLSGPQRRRFAEYAQALLLPGERKSMEPLAKCRNWIERDYQDLKGELGLDHFEGRSYVGWQHHVSMCLAAYAFLLAEPSEAFPPSAAVEARSGLPTRPLRRRGSPAAA